MFFRNQSGLLVACGLVFALAVPEDPLCFTIVEVSQASITRTTEGEIREEGAQESVYDRQQPWWSELEEVLPTWAEMGC